MTEISNLPKEVDIKNIIRIESEGGENQLEIDLNGGRIRELKLDDKIILGTFLRVDGKEGNTHVCCPNFGVEDVEYGSVSHGPGRKMEWKVEERRKNSVEISCILEKDGEGMGSYPTNLKIVQTFFLGNYFEQKVRVENIGDHEAPVNIAIHNYWNTPEGWENVRWSGKKVADLIKKDTFIDGGIREENEIEIPGLGKILLKQNGLSNARFWTANKDGVYDNDYACMEPAIGGEGYFASEESVLKPGEVKEAFQTLTIV
jgi:galactose mutarotase-like enzyme